MPVKKNKQPSEPFFNPPALEIILPDFNKAAALNLEAERAIKYWKDEQRYAMTTDRKYFAKDKLKAWQAVSDKAQEIMQSFQLKLL